MGPIFQHAMFGVLEGTPLENIQKAMENGQLIHGKWLSIMKMDRSSYKKPWKMCQKEIVHSQYDAQLSNNDFMQFYLRLEGRSQRYSEINNLEDLESRVLYINCNIKAELGLEIF